MFIASLLAQIEPTTQPFENASTWTLTTALGIAALTTFLVFLTSKVSPKIAALKDVPTIVYVVVYATILVTIAVLTDQINGDIVQIVGQVIAASLGAPGIYSVFASNAAKPIAAVKTAPMSNTKVNYLNNRSNRTP